MAAIALETDVKTSLETVDDPLTLPTWNLSDFFLNRSFEFADCLGTVLIYPLLIDIRNAIKNIQHGDSNLVSNLCKKP